MPKRDEAYIQKVRIVLGQTVWREAHQNFQTWLDMYEGKHKIRVAQAAMARHLPLASAKIQSLADTLITSAPQVHREPLSDSEENKRLADKVETWNRGLLRKGSKFWGLLPPFRVAGEHIGVYGYTTLGPKWDDSYFLAKPKEGSRRYEESLEAWKAKRKNLFPFTLTAPHPARVLLPPNERVPSMALEQFSTYAYQAAREYPTIGKLADMARDDPFRIVQGQVFWEEDWVGVLLDQELAMNKANLYGFVPWTHGFAGRGIEHLNASFDFSGGQSKITGSFGPAPEDMAKGILARNEDVITAIDEMVSAAMHMGLVDVYRTTITSANPTLVGQALQQLGAIIGPLPKDAITWAEPLQVQPWVFEVLKLLLGSLDTGTFAGVVQGSRTPGVDTATQHAIQLGQARLGFTMPMDQLNYMASQVLGMFMRMVVVNEEPITIDGITCGPDDFQGNYDIDVDFMAKDEAAMLRERNTGGQEVEKGRRSLETHFRDIGIEDGVEEKRRIFLDRAENSEQAVGAVLAAAVAAFQARVGVAPKPAVPAQGPGTGPGPGRPQGFIAQPGGPEEQAAAMQGMTQVPGNGIERALV